jgi:hypothetical protein
MRRALTIILILILLIGGGAFVYFYFFANRAGITVAPAGTTTLPSAGQSTTTPGGIEIDTTSPVVVPGAIAKLVKISAGPVVPGEVVINKTIIATEASSTTPLTTETVVNFIERQSGNVYSYRIVDGTLTRTSNKTVPGIASAAWLPDASFAFVRYLSGSDFSTINTYALPANGSGGFFLPQNLVDISVSSTSILSLASGVNGSVASTEHTDGTNMAQVFTTPLSQLRVSFAGKSQYLAFTKPSSALMGDVFLVNSTGRFSRVAGPFLGLVALASPSGKWVLVSYTLNNTLQMELVDTTTNETIPLPVATIVDKCVWTSDDASIYCGIPVNPPSGGYPDTWYQGVTHFSDRIWKIDVASRYAQLVLDFPKETKDALDAEALALDPLGTVLVFVNKNDGSLWSYAL